MQCWETDVSPFSGLLRGAILSVFVSEKGGRGCRFKGKGPVSKAKGKGDPATQELWHLPLATWPLARRPLGSVVTFWPTGFGTKGRCWRKHDACRIITIRFVKEKDKEKEPPRSRRVFAQVRNCCWLLSCCHNFRSTCCLYSMVCFVGHSSGVTPLGLGELLLLQGDRPKLERSLTQNLEEPKAKSKAVRMKVGPDRICQWWILGLGDEWVRWFKHLI